MKLTEKLHFLHRAYRYRFRSERFGVRFVRDRLSPGDTAIDIGANRGIFSYWMSKLVGSTGRIVAFEPQPELQESLRELKGEFSLDNVKVEPFGLSDSPGVLTMRRPETHWGGASFEVRESQSERYDEFEVPVITLDDYMQDAGLEKVDLIKCDVEGHELNVFRGGENLLRTMRPALLFECDDKNVPDCEVFQFLKGLGYQGYCFYEGFSPVERYRDLLPLLDKKAEKDFVFLG